MLAVSGINFNSNSRINSSKQSFKGKGEVVEEGLSYLERMGIKFGNATRPMIDMVQITKQAEKLRKLQQTIEERGINTPFANGRNTLLHNAVLDNDIESVEYLLKNGAKYSLKNANGETAMDLCRPCGELLPNWAKSTALAHSPKESKIYDLLAEAGADTRSEKVKEAWTKQPTEERDLWTLLHQVNAQDYR